MYPNWGLKKAKRVVFYSENIATVINRQLSKIFGKEKFEEAVEYCIKYLLVHELIHILQLHQEQLTKEIYDKSMKLAYEKRDFEVQADKRAIEIMGEYGQFAINICKMIKKRTY